MNHSEATETMATARYLLGELNEGERDAFEEHYFGCSECARDVRDGSAMIDSIRAGKQMHSGLRPAATLGWIVAAAAVAAAVFFGMQNIALKQPRTVPTYSLLTLGTRGANEVTTVSDPSQPFAFYVDIPPQPSYPAYRIEIRDSSNHTRVSVPVNANEARETITVYVPPHRLESGKYTVVIVGGDSATLGSAPLAVR